MKWLLFPVLFLTSCDCRTEEKWSGHDEFQWTPISFGGEGAAEWSDGVLSLDLGAELTGTRYDGKLPQIPYELELQARKITGSDFFCGLTFPVRSEDECLTFIVGGWGGGVIGLSSIDGRAASENETTTYGAFENERWYEIRLLVTEKRVSAFIDGDQIVDLETRGKSLGLRSGVIELCAPLGLATWQTQAEIKELRWRSLTD